MSRKVVVLDSHQFNDNRISKHISSVRGVYEIFRLNFNFYTDMANSVANPVEARVIDFIPFKNPYLNGSLFILRTLLGESVSRLEAMLRAEFIADCDDIVFHVHDPYLLGLAYKLSKRFRNSRIIYDRHEYYETWRNRFGFSVPGLFESWYGKHVAEIVFVSGGHGRFPRVLGGVRLTVIPNYPLSSYFSREVVQDKLKGIDGGDVRAVYFGVLNLNFDRDIGLMFQVMRSVMDTNERVHFMVAGRIYDQRVRNIMDEMTARYGDRISYLGEISNKEVIKRTQCAHLGFFLLRPDSPMWREDRPVSPNKVYEYLLSGTIPIVRATLDDKEVIERCSLMFGKEATVKDITEAVLRLVDDPQRMRTMIIQCYETGLGFSWERVAGRYLECYERLFSEMA